MTILAIDPGPTESAYLLWDGTIKRFGKVPNEGIGCLFREGLCIQHAVCERIRSFGMPAGAELFETAEWSGYFRRSAVEQGIDWHWITRGEVKDHLCHSRKANDATIRQSLIDRFGGSASIRAEQKAKPKKGIPSVPAGALYGIHADEWSALAVAVTWLDQNGGAA